MRGAAIGLVVLALGVSAAPGAARADDLDKEAESLDAPALFKSATDALEKDRPNEAIAKLEALGDRGVVDPVVSYNRGLAYAARVRGGGEQPGDLGRATHGFEEARELTHDPALSGDATRALATVRSEIARRRARAGESVEIEHGFSLGRAIVGLLPENAWAVIAALMALALSIAIVVRRRATFTRVKVAATTTASITGGLLVVTSIVAWAARDARLHLREGIVVTPNARLLDARHLAQDGVAPIPEGVRARIHDEGSGFSHVTVVGIDGWLPQSAVLPLAKR